MSMGASCSGEWPLSDQSRSSGGKGPPRPRQMIAYPDEKLVPQAR
jgi:hypothetical protein